MKKILLSILLLLAPFGAFASDDNDETPTITGITYTGNLSDDTVININGNYLEDCDTLQVGDEEVEIESISGGRITYVFGDAVDYDSVVYLTCGDYKTNRSFAFPYIESNGKIKDSNFDRILNIEGRNFGDNPTLKIEDSGTLEVQGSTENVIIGELPEQLLSNNVYIETNGLKSNVYALDLKIPKITFVTTEKGFYNFNNITIHGNNLNYYNDYYVLFGDDTIKSADLTYNSDGSISFEIKKPIPGNYTLNVVSNNIVSNDFKVKIKNSQSTIESIKKETITNDYGETESYLVVTGENFGTSSLTYLYINNKQVSIKEFVSESKILVDLDVLEPNHNYFELKVDGETSNVFDYVNTDVSLPYITGYEIGNIDGNYREIILYVQNYDLDNDYIYLDGQTIIPDSKYGNKVFVSVNKNTLIGEFSIGRGSYISHDKVNFDIKYETSPYITTLKFDEEPSAGVKFTIKGGNFSNGTFSQSNMVALDDDNNPKVDSTSTEITGYLSSDYDKDGYSSFIITKYGVSTEVSFIGSELDGLKIYGEPVIDKFESTSKDGLFRAGNNINVIGRNLRNGDIVTIGNKKVSLVQTSDDYYPYFTMPTLSTYTETNVYVTNSNDLRSDIFELLVLSADQEDKVVIDNNSVEKVNYYASNSDNFVDNPVYSLKIYNKIDDFTINNIEFTLSGALNNDEIGTFYLEVEGKDDKYYSMTNYKNVVSFDDVLLEKSSNPIILNIYKGSDFLNSGKLEISYKDGSLELERISGGYYDNIETETILGATIKILEKEILYCIDSENSNINCNSYYNGVGTTTNVEVEDTGNKFEDDNDEIVTDTEDENSITEPDTDEDEDESIEKVQTDSFGNYFTLNIENLNFNTSSYVALNQQFKLFALKIQKYKKYSNNSQEIEDSINGILEALYGYEQADSNLKKKIYIKKLQLKIKNFKSALK